MPAIADLPLAGRGIAGRRLEPAQLIALAESPPDGLELGASARAVFAVVELARRSVAEGLVHPFHDHGDGWWHAFWGATLDEGVPGRARPRSPPRYRPVGPAPSTATADAAVHDLYPVARRPDRAATACAPTVSGWRPPRPAEQTRSTTCSKG